MAKKFKYFSEEELNSIHHYILKEIAREIGVKSPASKKKEQLIEDIRLIQSGKLKPCAPTNKGAPKKGTVDLSSYYLVDDIGDYSKYNDKSIGELILNDVVDLDNIEVEGVLEFYPEGYAFMRAKNYEKSENYQFAP